MLSEKNKIYLERLVVSTGILLVIAIGVWFIYFYNANKTMMPRIHDTPVAFIPDGKMVFTDASTNDSLTEVNIKIANTFQDRRAGLTYVRELDARQGMLFIYEAEKDQKASLKNVLIPLDIIFLDENRKIISVIKDTRPDSDEKITSGKPARYMLQTTAGFAERTGLDTGDKAVILQDTI